MMLGAPSMRHRVLVLVLLLVWCWCWGGRWCGVGVACMLVPFGGRCCMCRAHWVAPLPLPAGLMQEWLLWFNTEVAALLPLRPALWRHDGEAAQRATACLRAGTHVCIGRARACRQTSRQGVEVTGHEGIGVTGYGDVQRGVPAAARLFAASGGRQRG